MVLMPRVTIVDADKISDEAAAAVAEVSQTVNGALRVKLHDKHAALVSIGKHLGMFVDRVQIQERKQISAEPMSAEEWKRPVCQGRLMSWAWRPQAGPQACPGGHDRNTAPEYFGLMGVAQGPLRRRHSGKG